MDVVVFEVGKEVMVVFGWAGLVNDRQDALVDPGTELCVELALLHLCLFEFRIHAHGSFIFRVGANKGIYICFDCPREFGDVIELIDRLPKQSPQFLRRCFSVGFADLAFVEFFEFI